jgi:ethanolamine utilization protein EutA
VLVIDGIVLVDFDYIDLGKIRLPSHTVPVTVKSLVFKDSLAAPGHHGGGHDHHHHHLGGHGHYHHMGGHHHHDHQNGSAQPRLRTGKRKDD